MSWFSVIRSQIYLYIWRFFVSSVSALLGLSKTTGKSIAVGLNSCFSWIRLTYQIIVESGLLLPPAEKGCFEAFVDQK